MWTGCVSDCREGILVLQVTYLVTNRVPPPILCLCTQVFCGRKSRHTTCSAPITKWRHSQDALSNRMRCNHWNTFFPFYRLRTHSWECCIPIQIIQAVRVPLSNRLKNLLSYPGTQDTVNKCLQIIRLKVLQIQHPTSNSCQLWRLQKECKNEGNWSVFTLLLGRFCHPLERFPHCSMITEGYQLLILIFFLQLIISCLYYGDELQDLITCCA